MKHLDLFSGIGGFALAAEMVWNNVEHIFCDNEPFSQEVLKKHWPQAKIYGDIRSLSKESFIAYTRSQESGRIHEQSRSESVETGDIYLLTGGFPCQPFSQAGRRRGTEDNRYLWPEMLRVIREFHPRWIIGENVSGLVTWSEGLVLEQIHLDLEAEGYEVQAFIIPAVAKNAPHRRDRVWIIANSKYNASRHAIRGRDEKRPSARAARSNTDWDEEWQKVAARLCRMDDGIPKRLDRNSRFYALGNAIVPQIAAEIMKIIKEIDLIT